jgi:hypothetical protein
MTIGRTTATNSPSAMGNASTPTLSPKVSARTPGTYPRLAIPVTTSTVVVSAVFPPANSVIVGETSSGVTAPTSTNPTVSAGERSSSRAIASATAGIAAWPASASPSIRRLISLKRSTESVSETLPIMIAKIGVENWVRTAISGRSTPVATASSTQSSR